MIEIFLKIVVFVGAIRLFKATFSTLMNDREFAGTRLYP